MKQISVLIAEDEPIVARYLSRVLADLGDFDVVAVCESGEEAEEMCLRSKPDLLITDIRMPGISGLELIHRLKRVKMDIQVIIVSGFKDFSYAKEAISLGVEDYITKPINQDELKSALLRVRDTHKKLLQNQKDVDMEQIVWERDEAAFHNRFPYNRCRALLVYQNGDIEDLSFAAVQDETRISFYYRNSLMVLVGGEALDKGDFRISMQQIIDAKDKGKTCTIMTVLDVPLEKDCFGVFQRLYRMLREQTIPGRLVVHRYESIEHIKKIRECQDEALMSRIANKIQAKEWRGLPTMIQELFLFWEKEQCDIYHMKMAVHQITDQLYKVGAFEQGKLVINEYLDDCLRYADSYSKIREMVCTYLEKVIRNRNYAQQEGKNADQICAEVRHYVLQNESKNFSLNEICYLFKVSQPFIRKAFRMYTGKSYNEWVLDTKIERAKDLLRENPKLLVKDVASQLGYEQLYFSTVFNKHVGMSPSEYKFRLQEEEDSE